MKAFEKALEDARRDVREGVVGMTLPERILQISPKTLYFEMSAMFEDYERFESVVRDEIFLRSRQSMFGRDHGIDKEIGSSFWLAHAPLSEYDDYRPYVEASMTGGSSMLFSDEIDAYVYTSGTSGVPKIFIESKGGTWAKLLVMRLRGFYMRTAFPVTGDRSAKNLTLSNYAAVGMAEDGHQILRASGLTGRSMRPFTEVNRIIPDEFLSIPHVDYHARDYLFCLMAIADPDLAKVFSNNLAHFGRMLNLIDKLAPQMIGDVKQGTYSYPVDASLRVVVTPFLPFNPQRAAELQTILNEQGTLSATPEALRRVWPRFSLASSWLNASTGRDAREVLRRLPKDIGVFAMGYGSSEGKWNIPLKPASASGVAAPFANVYEFLDLKTGKVLHPLDVIPGSYYELVATTYSGLVRYNLHDVVRIDGFEGDCPTFSFCGKSSEMLQVDGHVLESYQLIELFDHLEKTYALQFDLLQAFSEDGGIYLILSSASPLDYQKFIPLLNEEINRLLGLSLRGIYVVDSSYKQAYFDKREEGGLACCGIKVPVMVSEAPKTGVLAVITA